MKTGTMLQRKNDPYDFIIIYKNKSTKNYQVFYLLSYVYKTNWLNCVFIKNNFNVVSNIFTEKNT